MKPVIYLIQIVLAVLLIVVIMIQQKGTGLGSTFGSEMAIYRTKRGAEKLFFRLTVILTVLFIIASMISLLLQ